MNFERNLYGLTLPRSTVVLLAVAVLVVMKVVVVALTSKDLLRFEVSNLSRIETPMKSVIIRAKH